MDLWSRELLTGRILVALLALLASRAIGQTASRPTAPTVIALGDLFVRCRPDAREPLEEGLVYRTLGVARRTDRLDAAGRFALIHPVAACCPNGIAVGVVVRSDRVGELASGTAVSVRGRIRTTSGDRLDVRPTGHLERLELGILRDHVELVADEIEVYDRLVDEQLQDVAAKLDSRGYATFARILRATGWDETLRAPSYFSVLAPTEHAFARWTTDRRRELFEPGNEDRLEALVRRHVVPRWVTEQDLRSATELTSLGRERIPIEIVNGGLRLDGARVLFEDRSGRNGVVFALDRVLPASPHPARTAVDGASDGRTGDGAQPRLR